MLWNLSEMVIKNTATLVLSNQSLVEGVLRLLQNCWQERTEDTNVSLCYPCIHEYWHPLYQVLALSARREFISLEIKKTMEMCSGPWVSPPFPSPPLSPAQRGLTSGGISCPFSLTLPPASLIIATLVYSQKQRKSTPEPSSFTSTILSDAFYI